MSTNKARSQDSTAIVVTGDGIEATDDAPDWEGLLIEYDRYGEPAGHNYIRRPVCETEVLDGETSTTSHRPACHYE